MAKQEVGNPTSTGKPHSLNVGGEGMSQPQQLPCSFRTCPLAART